MALAGFEEGLVKPLTSLLSEYDSTQESIFITTLEGQYGLTLALNEKEDPIPWEGETENLFELQQYLSDLGFLADEVREELTLTSSTRKAILAYLREDTYFQSQYSLPTKDLLGHLEASGVVILLDRLNYLTNLDRKDACGLNSSLFLDDRNIYSRVLHYRLNKMGLYHGEIDRPVSQESLFAVALLKKFLLMEENPMEFDIKMVYIVPPLEMITPEDFAETGELNHISSKFFQSHPYSLALFENFEHHNVHTQGLWEFTYVERKKGLSNLISERDKKSFKAEAYFPLCQG